MNDISNQMLSYLRRKSGLSDALVDLSAERFENYRGQIQLNILDDEEVVFGVMIAEKNDHRNLSTIITTQAIINIVNGSLIRMEFKKIADIKPVIIQFSSIEKLQSAKITDELGRETTIFCDRGKPFDALWGVLIARIVAARK